MKTTETKLLTVQVPLDAYSIKIYHTIGDVIQLKKSRIDGFKNTGTGRWCIELDKLYLDYSVICTIHKENNQIVFSPGFEPEKYVDSQEIWGYDSEEAPTFDIMYRNYNESEEYWKLKCDQYSNAIDSFLSRIKAENGVYFDNPLGEKPNLASEENKGVNMHTIRGIRVWNEQIKKTWQEAESKVVKNKLVVLQKRN